MSFYHSNKNLHLKYLKKNRIIFPKKPAVFFDRDGVLIKECHYISKPEEVELEKGALKLLNFFKSKNWLNVIVTNQSGISRGYSTWVDYKKVTERILEIIGNKSLIDGIYANGCKNNSESNWRKPNSGMLNAAKIDLNIDIANSIIIGDRITDLQAGARAGLKNIFHVLTGHGEKERKDLFNKNNFLKKTNNGEFFIFNDKNNNCKLFLLDNLGDFQNSFKIQ